MIATLLSGTPACLLHHDSRTKELAEFASIPSISQSDFGEISQAQIKESFTNLGYTAFHKFILKGYPNYIKFLEDNSLSHTFPHL